MQVFSLWPKLTTLSILVSAFMTISTINNVTIWQDVLVLRVFIYRKVGLFSGLPMTIGRDWRLGQQMTRPSLMHCMPPEDLFTNEN